MSHRGIRENDKYGSHSVTLVGTRATIEESKVYHIVAKLFLDDGAYLKPTKPSECLSCFRDISSSVFFFRTPRPHGVVRRGFTSFSFLEIRFGVVWAMELPKWLI